MINEELFKMSSGDFAFKLNDTKILLMRKDIYSVKEQDRLNAMDGMLVEIKDLKKPATKENYNDR